MFGVAGETDGLIDSDTHTCTDTEDKGTQAFTTKDEKHKKTKIQTAPETVTDEQKSIQGYQQLQSQRQTYRNLHNGNRQLEQKSTQRHRQLQRQQQTHRRTHKGTDIYKESDRQ